MLWLKLLHALCWVYWLGADLGTFVAARSVANPKLSAAQRATAAKIMMAVDLAPRICMPLTLATGLHLAALATGLPLSAPVLAALWLMCLAWMVLAVFLHHSPRSATVDRVARGDFIFRALLAAGLAGVAALGLSRGLPGLAPFVAFKLLCFPATVVCGLAIRLQLRPFGAAFARLMSEAPQSVSLAQAHTVIAGAIKRCVPWVVLIWLLLLLSAAAGLHALKL